MGSVVRETLDSVINMRISTSELEMLDRLASEEGLPMTTMLRQLVRREHARRYGAEPAPRPKKRKPKK